MKKQVHVYYSGMVQGVGFRFTAEAIATDLGIAGWVKNLRDGRVELLAEGEEATLKEFLEKLNKRLGHYIKSTDIDWQEPSGEYKDFQIAFF